MKLYGVLFVFLAFIFVSCDKGSNRTQKKINIKSEEQAINIVKSDSDIKSKFAALRFVAKKKLEPETLKSLRDIFLTRDTDLKMKCRIAPILRQDQEMADGVFLRVIDDAPLPLLVTIIKCVKGMPAVSSALAIKIHKLAKHSDSDLRTEVIPSLGKIGGEESLQLILESCTDEVWQVRKMAAHALEGENFKKDIRIASPLVQFLKDPHWRLRRVAAEIIANTGHYTSETVSQLILTTHDEDHRVQHEVLQTLLRFYKQKRTVEISEDAKKVLNTLPEEEMQELKRFLLKE